MNDKRRQIQEELFEGFGNFIHQFIYPEMSADYFDKMRLRLNTDPLMRARVECLTASVMKLLDDHKLLDRVDDRESS